MQRLRNDLLDAYWWLVGRELCPCALLGTRCPDWASMLCMRLDAAWWRYRDGED